jgi:hypothetical protein
MTSNRLYFIAIAIVFFSGVDLDDPGWLALQYTPLTALE